MGDWGKRIRLVFDKKIFNVTQDLKTAFRLTEAIYGEYFYPTSVTYGANDHELYLNFDDFNWRFAPFILDYLGGTALSGKDFIVEPFTIEPTIINLNRNERGDLEYLQVSEVSVTGEIKQAFDGKLYADEYLAVSNIAVAGTSILLTFKKGYFSEYLQVSSVSVAGQYCDINGVPL